MDTEDTTTYVYGGFAFVERPEMLYETAREFQKILWLWAVAVACGCGLCPVACGCGLWRKIEYLLFSLLALFTQGKVSAIYNNLGGSQACRQWWTTTVSPSNCQDPYSSDLFGE